jgi:hypothetical protein
MRAHGYFFHPTAGGTRSDPKIDAFPDDAGTGVRAMAEIKCAASPGGTVFILLASPVLSTDRSAQVTPTQIRRKPGF